MSCSYVANFTTSTNFATELQEYGRTDSASSNGRPPRLVPVATPHHALAVTGRRHRVRGRSVGRRWKLLAPFRRHDLDELTVGVSDVHRLSPIAGVTLAFP